MSDVSGRLEQVLAELGLLHDPDADQELEALRIAILLEDSLDLVLDDADLDRLRVDGRSAVAEVVARHRERA